MNINGILNGGPPVGAAVDLSKLKRPSEAERRAAITQGLQQAGLVCVCGTKMVDAPWVVTVVHEGIVQGQTGPEAGLTFGQVAICSRDCAVLDQLGESAVAIRRAPSEGKITWLRDPTAPKVELAP